MSERPSTKADENRKNCGLCYSGRTQKTTKTYNKTERKRKKDKYLNLARVL